MQPTILLVDDDQSILEMLTHYFQLKTTDRLLTADSGQTALKLLGNDPDLILLDVNLPDIDGFSLAEKIRQLTTVPIIFLTARVTDADKVRGFGSGGDDYVVKPFSLAELNARIEAHLRREQTVGHRANFTIVNGLTINYDEKNIQAAGCILGFEKKQYQLIEFLSLNPGQVFDREQLYERVWGLDAQGDSRVVTEHIRRIRAILAMAKIQSPILTVWGLGYQWKN